MHAHLAEHLNRFQIEDIYRMSGYIFALILAFAAVLEAARADYPIYVLICNHHHTVQVAKCASFYTCGRISKCLVGKRKTPPVQVGIDAHCRCK